MPKVFFKRLRQTTLKYPGASAGVVIGTAFAAPIGLAMHNATKRKKRALKQLKSGKAGPELRYELERARRRAKRR